MALKPSAKIRGLRGAELLRRDQFYSSAWRPALRAAGLAEDRFKFHACRHWCASTLLAEGAPITAVAAPDRQPARRPPCHTAPRGPHRPRDR